ncbi:MAG: pseudaminic acid biosynthesis-associated methylase [Magnetococcales bacterium]|nr:pseudaminic acid biosynthesis-associated methylase [Magnetococcales bacterium]
MAYRTEQEKFWAGSFGDEYTERNYDQEGRLIANNIALFAKIIAASTHEWSTVLEFGANRGLNLHAIRTLRPGAELTAVEINPTAAAHLRTIVPNVHEGSILDFEPAEQYDFVLIKTVLIHIQPDMLPAIYEKLAQSSRRYVCICEYYNPTPVEVVYRGHTDKLFKRDFAGEFMAKFPEFRLVNYGFVYHGEAFPQDDVTWFLMERGSV